MIYVNDIIILTDNMNNMTKIKGELENKFNISDLGELNYYLGIKFQISNNTIRINQSKFINDTLKRFRLNDTYCQIWNYRSVFSKT